MGWRKPTEEELENEFLSEYDINRLYDASALSGNAFNLTPQKDIFLRTIDEVSSVRTLSREELLGLKSYGAETLEELRRITSHMGKDLDRIIQGLEGTDGDCPYVLLEETPEGLVILGGRNRINLCQIFLDRFEPVQALILDRVKINRILLPLIKAAMIEREGLFPMAEIWAFCEGVGPEPKVCADQSGLEFLIKSMVRIVNRYIQRFGEETQCKLQ